MRVPHYFTGLPAADTSDDQDLLAFCETHRTAVLAALPWFASEIAGREGFAVLFAIQRACGGRRIYLPAHVSDAAARLGASIQPATLEALRSGSGAAPVVDVPSNWGVFTAIRRAGVFQAMAQRLGSDQIIHHFGITQRHLKTYRRQMATAQSR